MRTDILFYTVLVVFLATAVITLLGLLGKVKIKEPFLRVLVGALLVEIASSVGYVFRKIEPNGPPPIRPTSYDSVPPTDTLKAFEGAFPGGLRIVAALPDPVGDDRDGEEVHVANLGETGISLAGWTVEDRGGSAWVLNVQDGVAQPGDTLRIVRWRRGRGLNNDGDAIILVDPQGNRVDSVSYAEAGEGVLIRFPVR